MKNGRKKLLDSRGDVSAVFTAMCCFASYLRNGAGEAQIHQVHLGGPLGVSREFFPEKLRYEARRPHLREKPVAG
jgi:hypothetical protein